MPKEVYLTKNGLNKLKEEHSFLTQEKRVEIARRIEEALSNDGPEDNFEYDVVREEQMLVEKRIIELEETLSVAKLIRGRRRRDYVDLGSSVVIQIGREKITFTIVGSMEANPTEGLISNESPLGKSLMGSGPGEDVEVISQGVRTIYKVIEIK